MHFFSPRLRQTVLCLLFIGRVVKNEPEWDVARVEGIDVKGRRVTVRRLESKDVTKVGLFNVAPLSLRGKI